jgi:hypothetical protein
MKLYRGLYSSVNMKPNRLSRRELSEVAHTACVPLNDMQILLNWASLEKGLRRLGHQLHEFTERKIQYTYQYRHMIH